MSPDDPRSVDDRPFVDDRPEVDDRPVVDHRLIETRAMDIIEVAVEVTAEPQIAVPRFADDYDVDLDPEPAAAVAGTPDGTRAPDGSDGSDGSDEVPVDPRIEQRRGEVVADKRRRLRRRLATLVALFLVGVVATGAAYSPMLDVDHIQIIGSEQLTLAQLADATGLRVGAPMLFTDPDDVQATLRDDPRFVRVVVTRQFPATFSIRLTDRRAIARVAGPTRGVVVGEGGVIIAVARGDEFLRTIEVPKDPPMTPGRRLAEPFAAAVDVMGSMSFEVAVQIERMRVDADGELVFELGEGRTVLFGTVEDAERKLLAVKTMLGPRVDTRGLCQLDVRVPTAPTIRRDPDCDPPPPPPVEPPADTVPVVDPATAGVPTTTIPVDAAAPPG